MKILLLFDKEFPIDSRKLLTFLKQKLSYIKFELHTDDFEIKDNIISRPNTFKQVHFELKDKQKDFDGVYCFTIKQYNDNYFFHEYRKLLIFSFYRWTFLTDLPISNGVIYFMVDSISLQINPTNFRHENITGCIYDFLFDKRGVDEGMRQARFCSNCLNRLSKFIKSEKDLNVFNDLKNLMNLLSESSRWNNDILETIKINNSLISKRKPKKDKGLQIVIASPGDTNSAEIGRASCRERV